MQASAPGRWLFGPSADLAWGCGGAYLGVALLLWLAPGTLQGLIPLGLLPFLVLFTGIPHYGATLVRVYEQREQRRRYRFFALWASLAVYAWFVLGVYVVPAGAWLLTLYLTWSPWHYTGQNYGLAVMFLRRRGVPFDHTTKRWLYASFISSYAIVFLGIHGNAMQPGYAPEFTAGNVYQLQALGIPRGLQQWGMGLAAAAYLLSNGVAWVTLKRGASWSQLAPVLGLSALQMTWFAVPGLAQAAGVLAQSGPFAYSLEVYGLLWIGIGHGVQYLWITAYYAQQEHPGERRRVWGLKVWLAGCAVWGVPAFLFAPDLLGTQAYDSGLALLVASAVNVQHFILDGAIWKLRDGRIARLLIPQDDARGRPAPVEATGGGLGLPIRIAVAVGGLAYAVTSAIGTYEVEFGVRRVAEPPDFPRIRTAVARLTAIGRDHAGLRFDLGMEAFRVGEYREAERELERSLALRETPDSWVALGRVAEKQEQPERALAAYEAARALQPDHLAALTRAAAMLERAGHYGRARDAIARAVEVAPEREGLRAWLARLERRAAHGSAPEAASR